MQQKIQMKQKKLVEGKALAEVERAPYRRQNGLEFVFWEDDDATTSKWVVSQDESDQTVESTSRVGLEPH